MAETIRLGMVRLTDAAPLVYAEEYGLFAAHGVAVAVTVEPSWANLADKLAWGLLDGAVMLPPLAIAMTLGLRPPAIPLLIPAGISLGGNAITLANKLADPLLAGGRLPPPAMAARLAPVAAGLRMAVVHAFSTHDLLLRLFFEQGGVDPAGLAPIAIPPAEMVDALAVGRIDLFCAGAPWGAAAAEAGVGRTIAVTSEIWPHHPEKCLAVRQAWAEANRGRLQAVLAALREAGRACDAPEGGPALADLLARREWLGVSAKLIAASLPGGASGEVDRSVFAAHGAQTARPEHGLWFLRQIARWRSVPPDAEARVQLMYDVVPA